MSWLTWFTWLSINFPLKVQDIDGLRSVKVKGPSVALVDSNLSLSCSFDLEEDNLYSLKWYHNASEFISFRPSDIYNILRVYELNGVSVDMDNLTDGTTIDLFDLNYNSQGVYKCEVIAEDSFQTDYDESYLQILSGTNDSRQSIISGREANNNASKADNFTRDASSIEDGAGKLINTDYPNSSDAGSKYLKPIIEVYKTEYQVGEQVQLNCSLPKIRTSSSSSSTKVYLHWKLPATWKQKVCPYKIINYQDESTIGLQLNIDPCHLDNGTIRLTCKGDYDKIGTGKQRLRKGWLRWSYSRASWTCPGDRLTRIGLIIGSINFLYYYLIKV